MAACEIRDHWARPKAGDGLINNTQRRRRWPCGYERLDSEHDLSPLCKRLVATGSGQGQGILWGVRCGGLWVYSVQFWAFPSQKNRKKGLVLPSLEMFFIGKGQRQ